MCRNAAPGLFPEDGAAMLEPAAAKLLALLGPTPNYNDAHPAKMPIESVNFS